MPSETTSADPRSEECPEHPNVKMSSRATPIFEFSRRFQERTLRIQRVNPTPTIRNRAAGTTNAPGIPGQTRKPARDFPGEGAGEDSSFDQGLISSFTTLLVATTLSEPAPRRRPNSPLKPTPARSLPPVVYICYFPAGKILLSCGVFPSQSSLVQSETGRNGRERAGVSSVVPPPRGGRTGATKTQRGTRGSGTDSRREVEG